MGLLIFSLFFTFSYNSNADNNLKDNNNKSFLEENSPQFIDDELDKNISKSKASVITDYQSCAALVNLPAEFEQCKIIESRIHDCLSKVQEEIIHYNLDEKLTCRRKTFNQFPNSLAYNNEEEIKQELKTIGENADVINQNNFTALGIDEDVFGAAKEESKKKKEIKSKIDSNTAIYSLAQLNQMRQTYLSYCYEEVAKKVAKFALEKEKKCK